MSTDSKTTLIRPLRPGVFCPVLTFFHPDSEDLDVPTFKKHIAKIAQAGMGIVVLGTNGEAIHLNREERKTLIKAARETLDELGFTERPLIAGTGGGSTRETIEFSRDAALAGASHALVITPGYFASALDKSAIKKFFADVAGSSPIPVMIYNYPGASAGIDLDSDLIIDIAKTSPNVCGVKLTCNAIGKLARIAAITATPEFPQLYPRANPSSPFLTLTGFSDTLLPSIIAKSSGSITGLGNLAPKACVRLFETSVKAVSTSSTDGMREAQAIQDKISRADFNLARAGIAGSKWLLEREFGYGGVPRRPLPPLRADQGQILVEGSREILEFEKSFA